MMFIWSFSLLGTRWCWWTRRCCWCQRFLCEYTPLLDIWPGNNSGIRIRTYFIQIQTCTKCEYKANKILENIEKAPRSVQWRIDYFIGYINLALYKWIKCLRMKSCSQVSSQELGDTGKISISWHLVVGYIPDRLATTSQVMSSLRWFSDYSFLFLSLL